MSPGRVRAARTAVVVAFLPLGFALVGLALPQTVEAAPGDPALTLTPAAGAPASAVTASTSGFEKCPPSGVDDAAPSQVAVSWDGTEPLGVADVTAGTAAVSFDVPGSATSGGHQVIASCVGDPTLTDARPFEVTAQAEPAVVPDLAGRRRAAAVARLVDAGLAAGAIEGKGVVRRQRPAAGSKVPAGTEVDLVLRPGGARLVTVPELRGLSRDDAASRLGASGLRSGDVAGRGDRVVDQTPPAGDRVRRGTAVAMTVDVAADAADAPTLPGGWRTVTGAALVLALVFFGLVPSVARSWRVRRDRAWVAQHLHAAAAPGQARRFESSPPQRDPTTRDLALGFEPHADAGTHVLHVVDR